MGRAKRHLRLILSEEATEEEAPPEAVSTVAPRISVGMVEIVFTCPDCGRVGWTADPAVRERWCTGDARGIRTHKPVEMARQERR